MLGARAYDAVRDLAARHGPDVVTRAPDVSALRGAGPTAPEEDRQIGARNARIVSTDVGVATRPLGLLLALGERAALDDAVLAGGAFRVASPADSGAMTSALSSHPEHVERWRAGDLIALGAPLREFIDARAGIVDVFARARSPSSGSRALDACLALDPMPAADAPSSAAVERYLSAYAAMMDAAVTAGGEVLDRALMLDIAYCPVDAQRRARLTPLHPLMVSRRVLAGGDGSEALPPVIAVRHHRTFALYAEGEPGFYHSESERWPTIAEQRGAVRDATRAWLLRAGEVGVVDVDLIDARFAALLVEEITSCVAQYARARGATPAPVRARVLASSLSHAAWFAPVTLDMDGSPVVCDPSVRSASEARTDALVLGVIPAPHGGRRPGVAPNHLLRVAASYMRALEGVRIDPRPHRLEPSPEPSAQYAAFISWRATSLDDAGGECQWKLSLRDDLAAAVQPTALSHVVSTPAVPEVPLSVEAIAATTGASAEEIPSSKVRLDQERSDDGDGRALGGGAAVVPIERRSWTRLDLRAYVARSLGRPGYTSDEALVADLVRDAVLRAARRSATSLCATSPSASGRSSSAVNLGNSSRAWSRCSSTWATSLLVAPASAVRTSSSPLRRRS